MPPTSPHRVKMLPERGLSVVAGILAAVLVLEGVLRIFATAGPPPVPNAGRDSFDAPVVVSRQIDEGIASARFSRAGARLTGNAPIPDAPVTVFLGDSYVVAREVADDQTMGSLVERLARLERFDINVRQYGWRGASAAQYLQAAQEIMQRWNPDRVVIVLSEDDLGADALHRNFPRLVIGANDQVSLVHPAGENGKDLYTPSESVLRELFRARWQRVLSRSPAAVKRLGGARPELRGPVPDPVSIAAVPRATVKALGRAFGPSLVIIYVADVRVNSGDCLLYTSPSPRDS